MKNLSLKLLLLSALLICFSCGQEASKNKTKLTFKTGYATDFVAGAIVYAQKQGGEERVAINVASTPEVLLENGNWNFYALQWAGPDSLQGALNCTSASKNLIGGATSVDLYMSQAACNAPIFSGPLFLYNNQPYSLSIVSCHNIASILGGSNLCTSGNAGISASYQVSLLDYRGFGFTTVSPGSNPLTSTCITASSPGTETNTGLLIPSGGTIIPLMVRIRAFEDSACSGSYEDFVFKTGLAQGISSKAKTFNYSISTMKVYLSHFPATITPVSWSKSTLATDSASSVDLSGFALGGRTPYTFSLSSGPGTISVAGVYTGGGSGTATITVTDAVGQIAELPVEAVTASVSYDFLSTLPSGWTLTRNTPSYAANATGILTYISGTNTGRFEGTPSGTPLGLLLESATASNALASALYFSTGWSALSTVVTATSTPTDPQNLTQAYSLTDDNTNGSNAGQVSTSPYLSKTASTSVFSVFAKAGTSSIVSLYISVPASSCSAAVFDLNNGTSTNSAFCSSGSNNFGMIPYTNGWYRIWVRHNSLTGSNWEARIFPAYNTTLNSSASITASGTAYFYGPEFEEGVSSLTSYLPGSTRDPDLLTKSINEVSSTEGTVFVEWYNQTTSINQPGTLFIAGGLIANNHLISRDANNKLVFKIMNTGNNVVEVISPNTIPLMATSKAAYAYNASEYYAGFNGVMTTATASGSLPVLPSGMAAGSNGTGGSLLNGHLRKITIWPKALTKEILEQLTL